MKNKNDDLFSDKIDLVAVLEKLVDVAKQIQEAEPSEVNNEILEAFNDSEIFKFKLTSMSVGDLHSCLRSSHQYLDDIFLNGSNKKIEQLKKRKRLSLLVLSSSFLGACLPFLIWLMFFSSNFVSNIISNIGSTKKMDSFSWDECVFYGLFHFLTISGWCLGGNLARQLPAIKVGFKSLTKTDYLVQLYFIFSITYLGACIPILKYLNVGNIILTLFGMEALVHAALFYVYIQVLYPLIIFAIFIQIFYFRRNKIIQLK